MDKTSLKYLQIQANLETVIDSLDPEFWTGEQIDRIRQTLGGQVGLLPAWLYVAAVEQAPVAISITDRNANILYVNKTFTEVTGYGSEEVLGRNESLLSYKSTPRQVYRELWHRISHKQVWNGILVNRHKQGQRYLADLTIAPMLDEAGQISHFIGMHRDVTESFGLERRVGNQKTLIETVVNSTPVAMVVLDDEDRVVVDNQMYKALISDLGIEEPALLFLSLLHSEIKDFGDDAATDESGFRNREVRIDLGGNKAPRWFSCAGVRFMENDLGADAFFKGQKRTYLLLTLSDVTQQKRQQEASHINTLRLMMAEEEQIRILRETLMGAIHRIHQPMNQIQAAKGLLERRGGEGGNEVLLELLGQVLNSGLETVATLRKCIPEPLSAPVLPVNLNQILHEVLLLSTYRLLASGVTVDWRPMPVLPAVLGSENRLRTMFKQLIDNAIQAMSAPGCRDRQLHLETRVEEGTIIVHVEDTGPGIAPEVRRKVFEPFYTTNGTSSRQAGLGLAMVQEIVNQHHGIIMIDPDYSGGCRMRVEFEIPERKFMAGR